MATVIKFKIPSLGITDADYSFLPFGRKLEYARKIHEFKSTAKTLHIGRKRRSIASAIKEFKSLYSPKEFYLEYIEDTSYYSDDSFQVWFTT